MTMRISDGLGRIASRFGPNDAAAEAGAPDATRRAFILGGAALLASGAAVGLPTPAEAQQRQWRWYDDDDWRRNDGWRRDNDGYRRRRRRRRRHSRRWEDDYWRRRRRRRRRYRRRRGNCIYFDFGYFCF